ncbi:MAG: MlaD family protein [Holosporales bacterium]|jgi:phospholipid/cholesterol/gamma-HCH transport system substrate-binding protein|nr:MlaD family protein [Holosporales bacterium]
MKGNILEAVVGAVVLVAASFSVLFAYFSGGEKIKDGYVLVARFDDVGGISVGSDVKLNGIKIGVVKGLIIDEEYQARAELLLKDTLQIPTDSSASITTDGLMGNRFIALSVGFSQDKLKPGSEIESTNSSINLEKLIYKFAVGMKDESTEK